MVPSAYLEKYNHSLPITSAMPTQIVSTPSEAAAISRPVKKTKSSSTAVKSKSTLSDVTTSDDYKKTKELKTRAVTGEVISLHWSLN